VVIAKMDSTENEVESIQVDGFPTLKLFKKDTNEIVDYHGKRELEALVAFLETGEQTEKEEPEEEDGSDYEEGEGEDEDYDDEEGADSAESFADSQEEEELDLPQAGDNLKDEL